MVPRVQSSQDSSVSTTESKRVSQIKEKSTRERSSSKSEITDDEKLPRVMAEVVLILMVPTSESSGNSTVEIKELPEDLLDKDPELYHRMRLSIAKSDRIESAMATMYVAAQNFMKRYPDSTAYFSPHWKLEQPWEIEPNG